MSKRYGFIIASLLFVLLVLIGCSSSDESSTKSESETKTEKTKSAEKKVVNIGIRSDPPSLDPKMSGAQVDRHVQYSIFDVLFELDGDGNIVPGLVEEYEISDDGKTYTFELREGIKFHDGTDFDAEAVKFNFERNMEEVSARRSELEFIDSITVVDTHTVELELSAAFAPLISILTSNSGMMVSPTAVEEYGDDFNNNPVGTGPYVFDSQVKGDHIKLKKNEDYWKDDEVKVDELVFRVFTNETSKVQNLISGDLDIIDTLPPKEIENIDNNEDLTAIYEVGTGWEVLWTNTESGALSNKYLRQAVSKAIDREALVKVAYAGYAQPALTPFAPGSYENQQPDVIEAPDAAEIKELLEKGGQPDGFTFKLQVASGSVYEQTATVIQGMLSEHNINMEIELIEGSLIGEHGDSGNFEAMIAQWSGRLDPDQNVYRFVATDGALNWARLSNEELDNLLLQARYETDESVRGDLYNQALEIIQDEVPNIYLVYKYNTLGVSNKVKDFIYVPDGIIRTTTIDIE